MKPGLRSHALTVVRALSRIGLGLVLFEAALQTLALVLWVMGSTPSSPRGGHDERVVLCVGDSFTFGIGASNRSATWPSRLQSKLAAATGERWTVVGAGWPGHNSRDLLLGLKGQLQAFAPELVLVLIGANEFRTRPEPLDRRLLEAASPGNGRFPIKFRTWLVLRTLADQLAGRKGPVERAATHDWPDFVGEWHHDQQIIRFEPGGRASFSSSEMQWSLDGRDLLCLRLPEGKEIHGITWSRGNGRLVLKSTAWPADLELRPGLPEQPEPLGLAWRALQLGEHLDALAQFTPYLDHRDLAVQARLGALAAHAARGETAAVERQLDWFGARCRTGGTNEVHDRLRALVLAGDLDGAVALACERIESTFDEDPPWQLLAEHGERPRHRARLERLLADILGRTPPRHRLRPLMLRLQAILARQEDPLLALTNLVTALALDGDEEDLARELRKGRDLFPAPLRDRCLERVELTTVQRARVQTLFEEMTRDGGRPEETLDGHLRLIVEACRRAGAAPLLLTYPFHDATVDRVVHGVAQATGTACIDLGTAFDQAAGSTPRPELFVVDGHCNDQGYDLIATVVAGQLGRRGR